MNTGTDPIAWFAANGVALVLLVVVLGGWAWVQPHVRRHVILGAVTVMLVVALLLVLFRPARVPTGWITVLMNGRSTGNIQQLYGRAFHSGSGFYNLVDWLTGHDVTTLPAVVHMNLCLAAVNTIIFFLLASYVLRSWWVGLLFALGYACNLDTLHAAFSETPATVWATHFWLGCIAAAVIDDHANTTLRLRRLALLWLALLVWLAALLRIELLLLGAPAFAVGAAKTFGWESTVRRMARTAAQFLRSIVAGRLSVFLIVSLGLALLEFVPWSGNNLGWVIAGLRPLNLSFLTIPWTLGVFLPLGLTTLCVLGMVYALRRWFAFFLLPVSVVILLKVYDSAAHGVLFVRLRHLTFLTPVVCFFALFGFRELSDWAQRWAWPPWWKRPALLLLVMSCTVWQPPGPGDIFLRRQQLPGLTKARFLLGLNQQTEVRYLLDLVARYPTCVFVAKTVQAAWIGDTRAGYLWTVFGRAVSHYREMPDMGESVEQVAEQLAPGSQCVLFYRSLDCDLVGFDDCRAETANRGALEERGLENQPFSNIYEYGVHRPEIHLGVYPVRSVAGTNVR